MRISSNHQIENYNLVDRPRHQSLLSVSEELCYCKAVRMMPNTLLFKCHLLSLFVMLFISDCMHATTFADRHQYRILFETGTCKQVEASCTEINREIEKWHRQGILLQEAEYTGLICDCLIAQGQYSKAMSQAQYAKKLYKKLLKKSKNENLLLLKYNYALVCYIIANLSSALVYDIQQQFCFYDETSKAFVDYCQDVKNTDEYIQEQHLNRINHSLFTLKKCSMMLSFIQHKYVQVVEIGENLMSEISKTYPDNTASRFDYIETQLILSYAYLNAGNYEQSLYYLRQIQETIEKNYGKDNLYYAMVLYRIGIIYYGLNDIHEADNVLFLCDRIIMRTGYTHHAIYAEILEAMGNLYLSMGKNSRAKEAYESAQAVIMETCGVDSYHFFLNQYFLAYYYFVNCSFSYVAQKLKNLLNNDIFLRETGDHHVIGAYGLLYEAAYRSNNFTDIYYSAPYVDAYVQRNKEEIGLFEACKLYIAIGRAYRYNGYYYEACSYFHKALECMRIMTRRSFVFLSEEQREKNLLRDQSRIEGLLLQNCVAQDDSLGSVAQLLYDAVLYRKGLLLNTSVNMARIIEAKGPELLKHDMHRLQLMMQSSLMTPEEQQACLQLEQQVQLEARKYGDFMDFTNYTWQDIKNAMSYNDIAIEFVCSQLNNKTIVSAEVLSKKWDTPRHIYMFSYSSLDMKSAKGLPELCHNTICQKIVPLLEPGNHVYFAPAGELYMLPIEYLTLPNGKRMDEVYEMHRVSSTRELITMKNQRRSQKKIALFGGMNYNSSIDEMEQQAMMVKEPLDNNANSRSSRSTMWPYLKYTMDEVKEIEPIMKSANYKVSIYTQDEGVEEQFKALSESHTGIIHVATHGFYETRRDMEYAGLIFAGANNFWTQSSAIAQQDIDDGILTADEIANLNLIGTDLVVLSACQTGLGRVSGEGLFGLQRAFKKAGVQSILMSLWEVDDKATQVLMTSFYQYLKAGSSKREALKKAQRQVWQEEFIRDGKTVSGTVLDYWGGFVLID